MIIYDLYPFSMAILPDETNPPLIIDADAVLPFAISLENLQPIRSWQPQIMESRGGVNRVELHEGSLLNITRKLARELPMEDSLGIPTEKRPDHRPIVNKKFISRQDHQARIWPSADVRICSLKNQPGLSKVSPKRRGDMGAPGRLQRVLGELAEHWSEVSGNWRLTIVV
jgi:hypothetical protein